MVNDYAMIQELLENLANPSGYFMLIINKRTARKDPTVFDTYDQEVFYADKDQAVSRLFDLCELYNWTLMKINTTCEFGSIYTAKWSVELRKEDEL